VLLAHLKQSSIVVDVGDIVTAGQEIGQFGNSGNTSQPHLHIQVMTTINFDDADSEPIPMIFNTGSGTARAFKRNDILAGD
jgi:murein DD-endopeptidase MepM/ murein hydrolase activator NlpD